MYTFLCGHMFSFPLGTYPGVDVLGHVETRFNPWAAARLLSTVAALFTFPPAVDEGFHFSTASPTLLVSLPLFLKDFIYLFLERRGGKEKDKDRNIDVREASCITYVPLKREKTAFVLPVTTRSNNLGLNLNGSFMQMAGDLRRWRVMWPNKPFL